MQISYKALHWQGDSISLIQGQGAPPTAHSASGGTPHMPVPILKHREAQVGRVNNFKTTRTIWISEGAARVNGL